MTRFILRSAVLSAMMFAGILQATAQTYPTAFDLAGGNYSFTQWDATSAAGTYPTSMVFHTFASRIEPFGALITDQPNGNWTDAYNVTSNARILGQGTSGVSFFQTGTANSVTCSFVGEAVLALNTTGRANCIVGFVSQVLATGTREYNLRLQYRIGSAGAWTNAILANGTLAQLVSATDGTSQRTFLWMMPTSLENQPLVQLRWIYFQDGSSSGGRPNIRLDDITVSSNNPIGTPTGLSIMSITPQSPSVNTAFNVMVRSVDAFGAVKNVATNTAVTLSKATGTGTLSGTLTGTILAGTNVVVFNNVVYNVVEAGVSLTAARTAGDVLNSTTSGTFTVGSQASYAVHTGAWHQAWTGNPLAPITVTVYRTDNAVDVNYTGAITASASGLSGTTTVNAFRGVAVFDNLVLNSAGSVTLNFSIPLIGTISTATITVVTSPTLTTNLVPQYIISATSSGTCAFSAFPIPYYAYVTINGLQPNTTYRFNTGADKTAGQPTSTGGGFNVNYHVDNNTYNYSGGKSLANDFSTFNSGNSTSKSFWINLVVTNATAFQVGTPMYWQVALGDMYGNLIRYYQLSQTSTLVNAGTASTDGTLIGDKGSQLTEKDMVVLWDNTAGTGRPVGTSIVQAYNTTVSFTTTRYAQDIENKKCAWMTMVPNTLATGIRRIEQRDIKTGNIKYTVTSTDGMWNNISTYPMDITAYPGGPGGFSSPIYINTPFISVSKPAAGDTLCSGKPTSINFRADGMQTVLIEYSIDNGNTYSLIDGNVAASAGTYTWVVPSVGLKGNCFIRIRGVDRPSENGRSGMFTMVEPLAVIGKVDDRNLCLGDKDTLIALVGGTAESFQWYKDGVKIPNALGPILYLTDVQYTTSGQYWCEVGGYGTCGDVVTNKATLRVGRKTQIVNQTFAVAGIIGNTVSMNVEVEFPNEVFSYQWYKGQNPLPENGHFYGTKSSRLEIRNFASTDYGNDYSCFIVGICQTARSRVIRVFPSGVYAEFATNSVSACAGATVNVPAMVYSNPPGETLNIRWYYNGQMLSDGASYGGTQTSTLQIKNVSSALAGDYTVRASLSLDPNVMSEATVTVAIATPPTITSQPAANTAVCEGADATLTVVVNAQGTVLYQWALNNQPIAGATAASYTIRSMSAARAGNYTVTATTACGNVTSAAGSVSLKPATVITAQPPKTLEARVGTTLTLSVAATGAGTVQYQWYKDGTALAGEIASQFQKNNVATSDAGKHHCIVTAECGSVSSDTTTVTTPPATGVDELLVGDAIVSRIAPNPSATASSITVSMANPAMVQVTVVDAAGNIVLTVNNATLPAGDNRLPILTASLPIGVYTVQTVIGGDRNVQQLVVLK